MRLDCIGMLKFKKVYSSMSCIMRKSKTVKLISTFVFATQIVQFFYFLNPKFPACAGTARFVSDLFKNHIVGFLMMGLICSLYIYSVVCKLASLWRFPGQLFYGQHRQSLGPEQFTMPLHAARSC